MFSTTINCSLAACALLLMHVTAQDEAVDIAGLEISSTSNNDGTGDGVDCYTQYNGNGDPSQGWPDINNWASFDSMWINLSPQIQSSCAPGIPNNSPQEMTDLYNAIQEVALSTSIDHRYILAEMMQESRGCVRVNATDNGVYNPGLMQDYDGSHNCNNNNGYQYPCPYDEIHGMINDAVAGTKGYNTGLAGILDSMANTYGVGVAAYYRASRVYNTGSIQPADLGRGSPGMNCYSSDIANWLTGWTGTSSQCTLDGQVNPRGSACAELPTASPSGATTSHTLAAPALAPLAQATVCTSSYTVQAGDSCAAVESRFSIAFAQLLSWNPSIGPDCQYLDIGYTYCVAM